MSRYAVRYEWEEPAEFDIDARSPQDAAIAWVAKADGAWYTGEAGTVVVHNEHGRSWIMDLQAKVTFTAEIRESR